MYKKLILSAWPRFPSIFYNRESWYVLRLFILPIWCFLPFEIHLVLFSFPDREKVTPQNRLTHWPVAFVKEKSKLEILFNETQNIFKCFSRTFIVASSELLLIFIRCSTFWLSVISFVIKYWNRSSPNFFFDPSRKFFTNS